VIKQPHFDSYSIPARICFGIAMFGGAALVLLTIASLYFMH
jgi:hypothetical protein